MEFRLLRWWWRSQISRITAASACWLLCAMPFAEAAPGDAPLETQSFEDAPAPMPRGETDADRIAAAALFAAGRTAERRDETLAALRCYQRAFRRDPDAAVIVRAIVPLAFRLNRQSESARYAIKVEAWTEADSSLLRRLGAHLTEQNRWKEAVLLYERAIASRAACRHDATDALLAMEMGRLYQIDEQYAKAAAQFDRVLEFLDRPTDFALDEKSRSLLVGEADATYSLMGECFFMAQRTSDARKLFQRAHAARANLGRLQFNEARILAHEGKPAEALAALDRALAAQVAGEGMGPYELLANLLDAGGTAGELAARLEALHARDPKNVALTFALARAYAATKRPEKAGPLLAGLMDVSPSSTVFRLLVKILRDSNDGDGLIAAAGRVSEKTGLIELLGSEATLIVADEKLMRSLEECAQARFARVSGMERYGVASAMASLMLAGKRYAAASEYFETAIRSCPDKSSELMLVLGVGLIAGEQYADAAAVLKRAAGVAEAVGAKGGGDGAVARFYLAAALALSGQTDEAIAAAERAVAARPQASRFLNRLGWVCWQGKRLDEARQHYQTLVERFDADYRSSETRDVVREAKVGLANVAAAEGRWAEAEEWLEHVLDEFPDDPGALNDLGYAWADRGVHLKLALRMIRQAVLADPDNAAFRDSLGWAQHRSGQSDEAVAELQRAAQLQPMGVVLDHLGDACAKAGRGAEAKNAWSAAADWYAKNGEPAKAGEIREKIAAARLAGG